MKKIILLLIIFNTATKTLFSQYNLFDESYIHEIRITFLDQNFWDTLELQYQTLYPDVPYQQANIEIDGQALNDIGIRQKGYSSNFFVFGNKKPLKIKFNEFISNQKFDGVKKINLSNGVGDPSMIKDKLAYNIMRFHGIPAPRVSHAKIYLNDTYWGIYTIIEQVDKTFLNKNFTSNSGNLWKSIDNTELLWVDNNIASYPEIELKTNKTTNDWSKIFQFLNVINNVPQVNFKDSIENIFNVDAYLKTIAIDVLLNNWDSYLDHGRNFYIYHEPKTDKITWIPWDYNFSFN